VGQFFWSDIWSFRALKTDRYSSSSEIKGWEKKHSTIRICTLKNIVTQKLFTAVFHFPFQKPFYSKVFEIVLYINVFFLKSKKWIKIRRRWESLNKRSLRSCCKKICKSNEIGNYSSVVNTAIKRFLVYNKFLNAKDN